MTSFLKGLRNDDCSEGNIRSGIGNGAKPAEGLYESDFDLFDRSFPSLDRFKQFARSCIREVVADANGATFDLGRITVEFTDSWFHVTTNGGFHDAHFHSNCSWCGIYYLKLGNTRVSPEGAANGGSRFYSPFTTGGLLMDYGNQYLGKTSVDPPISEGMLLVFPSFLLHSGLPYRGDEERIVVAFNTRSTLKA